MDDNNDLDLGGAPYVEPPAFDADKVVIELRNRLEAAEASLARILSHLDPHGTSQTLRPSEPVEFKGFGL